ncbi:MAG: hypothetical protein E4G96_10285 [Chrysiogenales bacterium]|nr:MAG: hypothetical protein E4G96_10285 [Chrysiogenales bacterium]
MIDSPHFSFVSTGDGSSTIVLSEYGEGMHSISGAYEEALRKHIQPSRILEREDNSLSVLDVGFGLGYNILAMIVEFIRLKRHATLSIVSLEKERALHHALRAISFNDGRDTAYRFVRHAYEDGYARWGDISIRVHWGDARKSVKGLEAGSSQAVFFDPFSLARNPVLWPTDFLREIPRVMDEKGVLTTYSSADHVRTAMLDAGLMVGRGPSVGGKREGTVASKGGSITPFTDSEHAVLRANRKSIPYRDQLLSADRESILKHRRDAILVRKSDEINQV